MSEKTGADNKNKKKKKKKHRINVFSRFVAFLARPLLWLIYPTRILAKERFPQEGGALCVCNHFSAMDANPILARLIKKKRHVMIKAEMFKNRLVGDFLRAMGGIPVRRGEADLAAVKEVMSALNKGEKVVVFPEGTRNTSGVDLQPLKNGVALMALKTKSQVIPLMYYKKAGFFKKNYLMVGAPFSFEEYYDKPAHEIEGEVTALMREKMLATKKELDEIVEKFRGNYKKYLAAKEAKRSGN